MSNSMKIFPSIVSLVTWLTILSFNTGFVEAEARNLNVEDTQEAFQRKRRANRGRSDGDLSELIGLLYTELLENSARQPEQKEHLLKVTIFAYATALAGDDLDSLPGYIEKLENAWFLLDWEESEE